MTDLAASNTIISGTSYDQANRLLSISGSYHESRSYNRLGQLTGLSNTSVNLTYAYSATQNNGKITGQTDNISGEQVVYTYDALNRLATAGATSNSWGQSYGYDGFGNLQNQTVTAGTAPSLSVVYNAATNRQTGDCADANGNIAGPSCVNPLYSYDVSNRIATAQGGVQYSYAPGNKRVWKGILQYSNPPNTLTTDVITFWSVTGQKLGDYNMTGDPTIVYTTSYTLKLTFALATANYYFGGKQIGKFNGSTVTYVGSDRLGSFGKYYPWGQEKPSATANNTEKFTGYFRDAETGLDYAVNRYHQPGMGRFLTPDRKRSAHRSRPGSWNRYSYTHGDPVNRVDRKGLEEDCTDDCDPGDCEDPDDCQGGGGGGGGGGDGCDPTTETCEDNNEIQVKVPLGNSYTVNQMQALTNGFNAAIDRISANDTGCAEFFAGGPSANAEMQQAEISSEVNLLENTTYRLLSLPQGNGVGAQTPDSTDVQINTDGAFFNATQAANGSVTVTMPNSAGVQTQYTFASLSTFQGFLLLHEFGHQTGAFGPDTNPVVNGSNSMGVLNNCFTLINGVYQ